MGKNFVGSKKHILKKEKGVLVKRVLGRITKISLTINS